MIKEKLTKRVNLSISLLFLLNRLVVLLFLIECVKTQNEDLLQYRPYESFVELKGGEFYMGINDREGVNNEYPPRKAIVEPFRINIYPVTIASFKLYKTEKYRHRTDAELIGSSWVFKNLKNLNSQLDKHRNVDDDDSIDALNFEMLPLIETRWNRPEGGDSLINGRFKYPVVHVSYNDAYAYCAWKGMRLPTEIEWEYATRGGLKEKLYPWGDYWELKRTNLWQGKFPDENQLRDGHYGLAPVDAFEPQNEYGIFDALGNVWEWTTTIFRTSKPTENKRVLKGGSFLDLRDGDGKNKKLKIRISARIGRVQNYSAQNVGFRCAQSIKNTENVNYNEKGFKIVKLRPPMHHHTQPEKSHFINQNENENEEKIKTEL